MCVCFFFVFFLIKKNVVQIYGLRGFAIALYLSPYVLAFPGALLSE